MAGWAGSGDSGGLPNWTQPERVSMESLSASGNERPGKGSGGGIWRRAGTSSSIHHAALRRLWQTHASGPATHRPLPGAWPALRRPPNFTAAGRFRTCRMNNAAINLRDAGDGQSFVASHFSCLPGRQVGIGSTLSAALRRHSGGKRSTGRCRCREFCIKTLLHIPIRALTPQT